MDSATLEKERTVTAMAELNVCIFCGKEPEKPRVYGYQLTPRRNTCYCIDHSCDNGLLVSVHGYSAEEVVDKWNKIMPAADVARWCVGGGCSALRTGENR